MSGKAEIEGPDKLKKENEEPISPKEKLVLSHEKFQIIFETSTDPVFLLLPDGRFYDANPSACELLKYIHSELLQLSAQDVGLSYPSDFSGIIEYKTCLLARDGSQINVDAKAFEVEINSREILFIIVHDTTSQKKWEEQILYRLRMEEGLSRCSKILFSDETADMREIMQVLLEVSDASRVYLYKNETDPTQGLCMRKLCEARAPEIITPEYAAVNNLISYNPTFTEWKKLLSKGEIINLITSKLERSPKNFLTGLNIKSALIIPIFIQNEWFGFIGFDENRFECIWKDEDIRLLKTVGEIVDSYFNRLSWVKQLNHNNKWYQSLMQNSSDLILVISSEKKIKYASPASTKIFNYSPEELVQLNLTDFVHPEDSNKIQLFTKIISEPYSSHRDEFRIRQKSGKWLYIECVAQNYIENSEIEGIILNIHDISERKQAQEIENRYKHNQAILSGTALEIICMPSETDLFTYVGGKLTELIDNPVIFVNAYDANTQSLVCRYFYGSSNYTADFEKEFGISPNELIIKVFPGAIAGLSSERLIPLANSLGNEKYYNAIFNAFTEINQKYFIGDCYNIGLVRGREIFGNILIMSQFDSDLPTNLVIETLVYQVSIALHRRNLEKELLMAKIKAEESDKLKSAFLANMSHEIRTPMNGIVGFAELLKSRTLTYEKRQIYIDVINENSKFLLALINDIIDLSKIQAGQLKLSPVEFNLNQLFDELESFFALDLKNKQKEKVGLIKRLGLPDEQAYIFSDRLRIQQILMNLIGNAIKFTPEGVIDFGYSIVKEDKKTFLLFHVKDTGIGLLPEKHAMIFDRFTQADYSTTRKFGGTGLGLAISKGLTELLGGRIWVESEIDMGSKFYFTLPFAYTVSKIQEEPIKEVSIEYNWAGKTILIAEDDESSYLLLEEVITTNKAKVLHVEDGYSAVEMIKTNPDIDIVLMDIYLPVINGYEATRQIKQFRKELPVIAQTANAMTYDKEKSIHAGCDAYFTKPINSKQLLKTIHTLIVSKS
jgi:PAS domain S-box-containing protein